MYLKRMILTYLGRLKVTYGSLSKDRQYWMGIEFVWANRK